MSPITRLLFVDAYRTYAFSTEPVVEALERNGVVVEREGAIMRFEYEDIEKFHVVMASWENGQLMYISMGAHVDGDENGWDDGYYEREMSRLDVHRRWMERIGIVESEESPLKISNSFHPKDQSTSITIGRA